MMMMKGVSSVFSGNTADSKRLRTTSPTLTASRSLDKPLELEIYLYSGLEEEPNRTYCQDSPAEVGKPTLTCFCACAPPPPQNVPKTKAELQVDMAQYQKAQADFDALEPGDPKRLAVGSALLI